MAEEFGARQCLSALASNKGPSTSAIAPNMAFAAIFAGVSFLPNLAGHITTGQPRASGNEQVSGFVYARERRFGLGLTQLLENACILFGTEFAKG